MDWQSFRPTQKRVSNLSHCFLFFDVDVLKNSFIWVSRRIHFAWHHQFFCWTFKGVGKTSYKSSCFRLGKYWTTLFRYCGSLDRTVLPSKKTVSSFFNSFNAFNSSNEGNWFSLNWMFQNKKKKKRIEGPKKKYLKNTQNSCKFTKQERFSRWEIWLALKSKMRNDCCSNKKKYQWEAEAKTTTLKITKLSRFSIFEIPLWLKYNSSKAVSLSNPLMVVMRLLCKNWTKFFFGFKKSSFWWWYYLNTEFGQVHKFVEIFDFGYFVSSQPKACQIHKRIQVCDFLQFKTSLSQKRKSSEQQIFSVLLFDLTPIRATLFCWQKLFQMVCSWFCCLLNRVPSKTATCRGSGWFGFDWTTTKNKNKQLWKKKTF